MTAGAIQADYADYSDSRRRHAHFRPPGPDCGGTPGESFTGHRPQQAFYLRELINQGLNDLGDAYLGAAALDAHRSSGKESLPPSGSVDGRSWTGGLS